MMVKVRTSVAQLQDAVPEPYTAGKLERDAGTEVGQPRAKTVVAGFEVMMEATGG